MLRSRLGGGGDAKQSFSFWTGPMKSMNTVNFFYFLFFQLNTWPHLLHILSVVLHASWQITGQPRPGDSQQMFPFFILFHFVIFYSLKQLFLVKMATRKHLTHPSPPPAIALLRARVVISRSNKILHNWKWRKILACQLPCLMCRFCWRCAHPWNVSKEWNIQTF